MMISSRQIALNSTQPNAFIIMLIDCLSCAL